MDELGSAPRINFDDLDPSNMDDDDQNGSWFGLAISGLKFLINNQRIHNINHSLHAQSPSSTNSNLNMAKTHCTSSSSSSNIRHQKKIRIVGPSSFKNALYGIPETQPTADNADDDSSASQQHQRQHPAAATALKKHSSSLTTQALQQFEGNFSNYWNQRSSLHSHYGSSNGEHGDDEAGGSSHTHPTSRTKDTMQTKGTGTGTSNTDGGSLQEQEEEEEEEVQTTHKSTTSQQNASMTSSQIIHPTHLPRTRRPRSQSYPLLHSVENMHCLQTFHSATQTVVNNNNNMNETATTAMSHIPSPPPTVSSSLRASLCLMPVSHVHATQSWQSVSVNSSHASHATADDSNHSFEVAVSKPVSLHQLVTDDHFVKQQQQQQQVVQWSQRNINAMQATSSISTGVSIRSSNDVDVVNVVHETGNPMMEMGTIGQIISCPIPKSTKKQKQKSRHLSAGANHKHRLDDEQTFSDWSNVSSNIGASEVMQCVD